MTQEEKLQQLLNDESFMRLFSQLPDAESMSRCLAEEGINIPPEQFEAAMDGKLSAEDGELSEEALNYVTGGATEVDFAIRVAKWIRNR